jgi:hypothetical protein
VWFNDEEEQLKFILHLHCGWEEIDYHVRFLSASVSFRIDMEGCVVGLLGWYG